MRPESSGALAAWREDNADELREMEKIRKWMAERGIALTDTTYTDLLARRDGVKADAANLASAAGDIRNRSRRVTIGLVGKYVQLHDAYLSVAEALRHAGYVYGTRVDIQ